MKKYTFLQLALIFCLFISACGTPTPAPAAPTASAAEAEAMLTFRLSLLTPLPAGEAVSLVVLDEISGLPFHPKVFPMQAEDAQHFISIQPFPLGVDIKYRYVRVNGAHSTQEFTTDGQTVRYRLLRVDGPGTYQDIVSRWADTPFTGAQGRVRGKILNQQTSQPLADILIFAGGAQTITDANGSFDIEGLPAGTHNLVAYAQDGSFAPAQQGAVVAAEAETPVELALAPRPLVNVTFVMAPPAETPANATVRLAGNLAQLGNSFASLAGESSTLAANMPALSRLPDGRYSLTLALPAGAVIEYRYTLGDGLWNTEHTAQAAFKTRRLTVPAASALIEDQVETWRYGGIAPILFQVALNSPLPAQETPYIQFNPGYGWTEAIPLWAAGGSQWNYALFSPLVGIQTLQYRYCRNGQCGSADDALTAGPLATGRQVIPSTTAQSQTDSIDHWAWMDSPLRPAVVPAVVGSKRADGFLAGIEMQTGYHPSWRANFSMNLQEAVALKPNWLILTPKWHWLRQSPPVLAPITALEMSSQEILAAAGQTQPTGVQIALFPQMYYPDEEAADWWQNSGRDFSWWISWFEAYRTYSLHFARLAAQSQAGMLILGGENLAPALPAGLMPNQTFSGVPADAEQRWRELLREVHGIYSGPVYWALPLQALNQSLPPFLDAVDGLYLLWAPPLNIQPSTQVELLAQNAGLLMDAQILPLQQQTQLPVILAAAYPSARGGVTGCLPGANGCIPLQALERPQPDLAEVILDVDEQEAAYNALFLAVNQRPWINGFVVRGYYLPLQLQDKSASVHGKPASGSIWYWFGQFLGK